MKKLILILVAFGAGYIQSMDIKYGVSYFDQNHDIDVLDFGPSNVAFTASTPISEKFSAEIGIALSLSDGSISAGGDTVKIDSEGYFLRGYYHITETFFVNAIWSYFELDMEVLAGNTLTSGKLSDTELGFGIGMSFSIPNLDGLLSIGYEDLGTSMSEFTSAGAKSDADQFYLKYQF